MIWIIAATDARRITAAEICMRKTAGYTGTDYKTNTHFAKELHATTGWANCKNTETVATYKQNAS
jgi:hypothetical protein